MKFLVRFGLATASHLALCGADPTSSNKQASSWTGWGGSYLNNRWSLSDAVSTSSIGTVGEHCKLTYHVGVSAPPAISKGIAYYTTWNGSIVALDYNACQVKWEVNATAIITTFGAITEAQNAVLLAPVARTSPQVDEHANVVYIGTQIWALMVALDLDTGEVLATMQVNPHPFATITMSPTLYKGTLFVGASSGEEVAAVFLNTNTTQYECCSFIGNVVALTFDRSNRSFHTTWNVPMIPPDAPTNGTNGSWSGVGVWGSQPAIDVRRNQVFFATGNTYTAPDAFLACTEDPTSADDCVPPGVLQESVIALDIHTGQPNWVSRLNPLDAWTLVCGVPGTVPKDPLLCPQIPGNDTDFGMAPAFVPGGANTPGGRDIVTVGQKNGNLYALDAETGAVEWATVTSPGGPGGGLIWGVAADESRVYFTAINYPALPWTLVPSNVTTNTSGFGAVNMVNGEVIWSVATPVELVSNTPPTVVGDLLLTGWTGPPSTGVPPVSSGPGTLLALNRTTGEQVLKYDLESPFYGGVAVKDNYLLLGTGYKSSPGDGYFYVLKVDS